MTRRLVWQVGFIRRQINGLPLLILTVLVVVLGVGIHFLHAFQVKRNGGVLRDRAHQAEREGKLDQAINYYSQYLGLVPTDNDALAAYGKALRKQAKNEKTRSRALLILEQALRRDPQRHDVRQDLAVGWMDLGEFGMARDHLLFLLEEVSPNDGHLEQLLGKCCAAEGAFRESAIAFARSVRHSPDQVDGYASLAALLRVRHAEVLKADRNGRNELLGELAAPLAAAVTCPPLVPFPASVSWAAAWCTTLHPADLYVDAMVTTNVSSYRAHLLRWRYRKTYNLPEPDRDLARARELASNVPDVILASAEAAQDRKDWARARMDLRQGIKLHPQDRRMYDVLVELERRQGRLPEALAAARQGAEALADSDHALISFTLADLLIDNGDEAEAADILASLRKPEKGLPLAPLQYLEGRLLMQRGQWVRSIQLLEAARPQLAVSPPLSIAVNLLLAQCYERVGDPDRQLAACRRAVAVNPLWTPSRLALAAAQAAHGATDDAMQEYQLLAAVSPAARVALARLQLAKTLRQPLAERDWQRVDQLVEAAARAAPENTEVVLLKAQALTARDRYEDASQVLEAACKSQPRAAEFWVARAGVAQMQGNWSRSVAILDDVQRELGDLPLLRLARVRHWAQQGGAEALPTLAKLSEGLETVPPRERQQLVEALVGAHLALDDRPGAEQVLVRATADLPDELRLRVLLYDVVSQGESEGMMERVVGELRRIEGPDGTWWRYCEARRLLSRARQRADRQGLPQARVLLHEVADRRPGWTRVTLLEAELAELSKNWGEAVEKYKVAVQQGERQTQVVSRLVYLLGLLNRSEEVKAAIRALPEDTPLRGPLGRAAAEVALREGDSRGAVDLGRKAVLGSKQAADYVWLGGLLLGAGQPGEAEKALGEALRLDEKGPEPWFALVQFLVMQKRKPEVEAVIDRARKALPDEVRALALARCYEVLGRRDQAEVHFKEALAAWADDLLTLYAAANFYSRTGRTDLAEVYFRKVIDHPRASEEMIAGSRRSLALKLSATQQPGKLREGLALIDQNLHAYGARPEDQRVKAILLGADPRRRPEAIVVLEGLVRTRNATAGDRFLLARLYEDEGNWPRAREHMLALLASPEGAENTVFLNSFIGSLLRRGGAAEAQTYLERLEKLEPTSPRTLNLKVQVLAGLGQKAEAAALLKKSAKDVKPEVLAPLLEELGDLAEAEALYRQILKDSKQPESVLALIALLGRQKRYQEALDLCERAWKECPVESAARASVAILSSEAEPEHFRRVEHWLEPAAQKYPDKSELWLQLAALRYLEGKYPEAARHYRTVLARNSKNPTARNNLAWILAMHDDQPSEALGLIEEAVKTLGSQPTLLATRGVINLKLGKNDQALKDLQQAATGDASPSTYLHLAHAHLTVRDSTSARDAWRKAKAAGLEVSQFDPLERPIYHKLFREFD